MGSSTGNLLVDNPSTLDNIFSESEILIATHCEDEQIIKKNFERLKAEEKQFSAADHPIIRSDEACYESSLRAIQLATKYNTRLHILHISTAKELPLFGNMMPLKQKRITAEVCVHHLHFTSNDYHRLGNLIKCNPAIKEPDNRDSLWKGLHDNRLDVIATDHAPHLLEEKGFLRNADGQLIPLPAEHNKSSIYESAHAGLPLIQHSLLLMLYYHKQGRISLELIAEKMSHGVAECFQIKERGFIREGYFADLVIIDLNRPMTINKDNIWYKCGWSPLENMEMPAGITHTFVNGNLVLENGNWNESNRGQRLYFER